MGKSDYFTDRLKAYLFISVCVFLSFMGYEQVSSSYTPDLLTGVWLILTGAGSLTNEVIVFIRDNILYV